MPSDAYDTGLLAPVAAGRDDAVSDQRIADALVQAEVGLVLAAARLGLVDDAAATRIAAALHWNQRCRGIVDPQALAIAARSAGNPVVPLVPLLREQLGDDGPLLHRGPTSQDILDSAIALVAAEAVGETARAIAAVERSLLDLAREHRDVVTPARTLTQVAVPTTVGLRATVWLQGVRRAEQRLRAAAMPVQLGGAAGTLASFVALYGEEAASALPAAYASELGLEAPLAPWHTARWPVTELGDAIVQLTDALGVIAADVAMLARSGIGELHESDAGGSSTMPHKANPVRSVLVRSAALRAPHLAATLHTAAANAVDERPDGAWHAEWPALRELLRLALGTSATAAELLAGLQVDRAAIAANLAAAAPELVAERERLVGERGEPGGYLGLAGRLIDDATGRTP